MPSLKDRLKAVSKPVEWRLRPDVLLTPQIPKPMHGIDWYVVYRNYKEIKRHDVSR
jgi:hypothetical protein